MPPVLGVLLLQSVAQLCDHGLVVGPLPVVDDQPAGAAGQQLVLESELTTTAPVSSKIQMPGLWCLKDTKSPNIVAV